MDHLDKVKHQIRLNLFFWFTANNIFILAIFSLINHFIKTNISVSLLISLIAGTLLACFITTYFTTYALQPLKAVRQLILSLSPSLQGTAVPDIQKLGVGRELVTALSAQVYQFINVADQVADTNHQQASNLHNNFIAQNLPLPFFVIDSSQNIRFANVAAGEYIGITAEDIIGKNVYMVLDMAFPSTDTFDTWLKTDASKKAVAVKSWERVRLSIRDTHPERLFDLAAYYNRSNTDGNETMLVMFDHTKTYSQDEQAISFMALSVHELRTPLTLLRGYIEVFEDELGPSLNPEQRSFMLKMHTQSEQLMDYINNILNVTRVDDDQLELHLQSGDWATILKSAIEGMSLRAKVRGISLNCNIEKGMPPVAVDNISIQEVVNNLIDNAIKYSGQSKVINISATVNKEGLIETTIEDFGNGIPTNLVPNLFTKFYRDHRNRAQIGGTGLGLYLSKAIITAHRGNIWVRSVEGKGSVFGFDLMPYALLAKTINLKPGEGITESAHGWIKNHSLYRR